MIVDIIIPSCKNRQECIKQIDDINNTRKTEGQIIFTGLKESAAKNRNYGLKNTQSQIVIMLDDDMMGFYNGWDLDLINPLIEEPDDYSLIAARLINKEGGMAGQLGDCDGEDIDDSDVVTAKHTNETNLNITGSTCIAFHPDSDIWFDEQYEGATFEDADFSMQMNKKYPSKKIVINNKCKLIHLMEAKGRIVNGINISDKNRLYFQKKWNIII